MISKLWNSEPAMVMSLIKALITLAVSFGLKLSTDQILALTTVVTLFGDLVTRSQVASKSTINNAANGGIDAKV